MHNDDLLEKKIDSGDMENVNGADAQNGVENQETELETTKDFTGSVSVENDTLSAIKQNPVENTAAEGQLKKNENEEKINEEPQLQVIPESKIKPALEAFLFVAGNSISAERMKKLLDIDLDTIRRLISEINLEYKNNNHCFRIVEVAGGFQLVTRSEFAEYIRKFFGSRKIKHISPSSLETLSIIAYQQPVTKARIEHVRGVNSDMQVQTLLEKKLIEITGRAEEVGRPLLYGTTKEFLEYFGLRDLSELPNSRELDQIIAEHKEEEAKKVESILSEIDGTPADQQSEEQLTEAENLMRERIEKENLDKKDDEELEKEFAEVLQREKKIRKNAKETFEKISTIPDAENEKENN